MKEDEQRPMARTRPAIQLRFLNLIIRVSRREIWFIQQQPDNADCKRDDGHGSTATLDAAEILEADLEEGCQPAITVVERATVQGIGHVEREAEAFIKIGDAAADFRDFVLSNVISTNHICRPVFGKFSSEPKTGILALRTIVWCRAERDIAGADPEFLRARGDLGFLVLQVHAMRI